VILQKNNKESGITHFLFLSKDIRMKKKKFREVIREDYYYRDGNNLINYKPFVPKTEEEIIKEEQKKQERTTTITPDDYLKDD
jgi:hypothetical protein